ncbi:gametocyte-specific factor 1-like [Hermetia illucens]|uniref:gametocyte-specific factor 1-like n=1 Tax=Hermetia illucens TaxID=343691 RepID=UPI0018CBFC82|nr:gametocyte-specific factor 1-like [Hermetia illucens]XP_037919526.1 gametocyte-specific factor 1-like [Hermetia illucens]XP_037919536.1 gametocyte-specific factor 1-like [Hermetia illucens]
MDSEFLICPYNQTHRVLRFRMPAHLIKCKKYYQGEPLQTCPFNATHLIRPDRMAKHLEICDDYLTAKMEKFYAATSSDGI